MTNKKYIVSRIGKIPVKILNGVKVSITDLKVSIEGVKGKIVIDIQNGISVKVENDEIVCGVKDETKKTKALHGLNRALLNNGVIGVSKGFRKTLEIRGVGYQAISKGKNLQLKLGYSHLIDFECPKGIDLSMDKKQKNVIHIDGIDKCLVGQVAAEIRSFRKPEPYKGKGVRYIDEVVIMKQGKSIKK